LAGYEDVNNAERLRHDPAMSWIVDGKAAHGSAASPSQMGRFETQWLATDINLSALTDLCGHWIDTVHSRRPPRGIFSDQRFGMIKLGAIVRNAHRTIDFAPTRRTRRENRVLRPWQYLR
jgi:hypothetical protein